MGKKVLGWASIVVGVLVAPHWVLTQIIVSLILIAFGFSLTFGGFPIPAWIPPLFKQKG